MLVSAQVDVGHSHTRVCMCVYMEARDWCLVSSSIALYLSKQSRVSYLNWESNNSAGLSGQLAPGGGERETVSTSSTGGITDSIYRGAGI